jgi:copper resistance protein B
MRAVFAIATLLAMAKLWANAADAVAAEAHAITAEAGAVAKEADADSVATAKDADVVAPAEDQHAMSYREMADTMQMDDTARFGKVMLDQLEWRDGGAGEGRAAWDAQGYYGGDYDKLWIKTEGKYVSAGRDPTGASSAGGASGAGGRGTRGPDSSGIRDADVEVLWNRVISTWWNVQAGGRQDFGPRQSRTWAAVGLQGLAPQWFETEATVYASDEGRTAARLKAQYDLLLTQRLVLQPFAEANLYGRSDPAHHIGSGLSDLEISIRLRYEVRREFAPYLGLVWLRRFGGTADLARSTAGDASDLELVAGLRVWL